MPPPPPRKVAKAPPPPPKKRTTPTAAPLALADHHPEGIDFRIPTGEIPPTPTMKCPRCGGTIHENDDGFYGPCNSCRAALRAGTPPPPGNHLTPQPPVTDDGIPKHMMKSQGKDPKDRSGKVIVQVACGLIGTPYTYKDHGLKTTVWRGEVTCPDCMAVPGVATGQYRTNLPAEPAEAKKQRTQSSGDKKPKSPPKPKKKGSDAAGLL